MGSNTRSNMEKKDLIKSCVSELISDTEFLSTLTNRIADEVEKRLKLLTDGLQNCEGQIETLNSENKVLSAKCLLLENKCDSLEQYSRRNNIRISGIQSVPRDKIEDTVLQLFNETMGASIVADHIDRCHPVGKVVDDKVSILVKFSSYRHRKRVLQGRKSLRGTKIRISEDLTSARHSLFRDSVTHFGGKQVYIFDGNIYVRIDDRKLCIQTDDDLLQLKSTYPPAKK